MSETKKLCNRRSELNITAKDLNELDDPLDNIFLDVMFECFYQRVKQKKEQNPQESAKNSDKKFTN